MAECRKTRDHFGSIQRPKLLQRPGVCLLWKSCLSPGENSHALLWGFTALENNVLRAWEWNWEERWPSDKPVVCCAWWSTGTARWHQPWACMLMTQGNFADIRLASLVSLGVSSSGLGTSITQSQVTKAASSSSGDGVTSLSYNYASGCLDLARVSFTLMCLLFNYSGGMIYSFKEVRLMASGGFIGKAIRDVNPSLKIEPRRQILGITQWKLDVGIVTT